MSKPLTAWSFSRLETFEQCPYKFMRVHIDGLKLKPNEHLLRGRREHKRAEDFLKGETDFKPTIHSDTLSAKFDELRALGPVVEHKWAMTEAWQPSTWFAQDTWVRVIPDAYVLDGPKALCIDHKTGKRREEKHVEQAELQALALMLHHSDVYEVDSRMWYLDEKGRNKPPEAAWEFTRDQIDGMVRKWSDRAAPMFAETRFPKRPSRLCGWCDLSHKNGGECEFG